MVAVSFLRRHRRTALLLPPRRRLAAPSSPSPSPRLLPLPRVSLLPLAQCRLLLRLLLQLRQLAHVTPAVAGIRRTGSASTDLAWVAAGRFDGYWEAGLAPWDVAPGLLLVKEAGGSISDFSGTPGAIWNGEVVAGNESIQGQLLKIIKSVQ